VPTWGVKKCRGDRAVGKIKHDPVTGRETTGHEWNGIEELDTPVPRIVLFFLAATALFALGYWILMPAWPLGWISGTRNSTGRAKTPNHTAAKTATRRMLRPPSVGRPKMPPSPATKPK